MQPGCFSSHPDVPPKLASALLSGASCCKLRGSALPARVDSEFRKAITTQGLRKSNRYNVKPCTATPVAYAMTSPSEGPGTCGDHAGRGRCAQVVLMKRASWQLIRSWTS